MQSTSIKTDITQYKCLIFIAMIYVSLDICCPLLANKWIALPFGFMIATNILSAMLFVLNDIVAEVYGYRAAMIMFFLSSLSKFSVLSFCQFLVRLPPPNLTNSSYNNHIVFTGPLTMTVFSFLSLLLATHINSYLLTKWKILLSGKYFWIRSIASSALCEIFYSFLMTHIWFLFIKGYSYHAIFLLFLTSFAYRILFTAISVTPSTVIVAILKRIERVDIYEAVPFNPFKVEMPYI